MFTYDLMIFVGINRSRKEIDFFYYIFLFSKQNGLISSIRFNSVGYFFQTGNGQNIHKQIPSEIKFSYKRIN